MIKNYSKQYINDVFRLIPNANYIAINQDNSVRWSSHILEKRECGDRGFWMFPNLLNFFGIKKEYSSDSLGYVSCKDWRTSLEKRVKDALQPSNKTEYIKEVFNLIPEANYIAINSKGVVLWSEKKISEDYITQEMSLGGSLGYIKYFLNKEILNIERG